MLRVHRLVRRRFGIAVGCQATNLPSATTRSNREYWDSGALKSAQFIHFEYCIVRGPQAVIDKDVQVRAE